MHKKIHFNLPVGIASILLIFLTLGLISFAVLTLQTALADKRLTDKTTAMTRDYYAAVHQAEGFLADTDYRLSQCYADTADRDSYLLAAGGDKILADFPISELQYLHVELETSYPTSQQVENASKKQDRSANEPSCFYKIICFKVITRENDLEYEDTKIPIL